MFRNNLNTPVLCSGGIFYFCNAGVFTNHNKTCIQGYACNSLSGKCQGIEIEPPTTQTTVEPSTTQVTVAVTTTTQKSITITTTASSTSQMSTTTTTIQDPMDRIENAILRSLD